MKAAHFLIWLPTFIFMLGCNSNIGVRCEQTFTFVVSMEGSQQRPDSDFERLVGTYVEAELHELPDVRVVPKGEGADWRMSLIGWEGATPR